MIKVENEKRSYMTCNSCNSAEDVKNISIGFDERQTSSFRLCKKCCVELTKKFKEV